MSYIYVIGNSDGPVKVGFSTNPKQRLSAIRNVTPVPIDVMACFHVGDYYSQLEGAIHLCLRDARQSGEWFDTTADAAKDAIQRAAKIAGLEISDIDVETLRERTAGERLLDASREMRGETVAKRRGPKPSGNAKQLLSIRLDQDVIAKFRATGPGWQARMNDVLKAAKV